MTKLVVRGAVAAVALAFSGIAGAETLKEIVTYAIQTHPQVLSAARHKEAADSAIDAAKGGYYPKIDYLYGSGRAHTKNPSTLVTTPDYVSLNRTQESLVINQMLFDGQGTSSEVDRRRAISDSSAYRVYSSAEDTALDTINAYLDVLKNNELVQFAKENLAAHQKTYDQVKLRAEKGVGRRADLDQIDARLALAVSNLAAAESTLRDAEIAYLKVVGKMPVNLNKPDAPSIPASVDEALKIGLQNHPVLKSALSDVDAAQAQREIAKSFNFPRLELEANYSDNRNLLGVPGPYKDETLMLWVKWNVFRGGFDYYHGRETAKQITEAQEIARNTNRQVEAAVRLAYNAYATARDRIPSLERYVKSSDQTRVAYAQQFAIGQRTLLDLLDSENEYFTSRSTLANGQYIELGARYRVLNAMGGLLTALDVKPPEEATLRSRPGPGPDMPSLPVGEKKADVAPTGQQGAAQAKQAEPARPAQAAASPVEQQQPAEAKPLEQPQAAANPPAEPQKPEETKQSEQAAQPQSVSTPAETQQPAETKQPGQAAQPQAAFSPTAPQQSAETRPPDQSAQPQAEDRSAEQQPAEPKQQPQPQADASPAPQPQQAVEAKQEQPKPDANQAEQEPVEAVVAERRQVEDADTQ